MPENTQLDLDVASDRIACASLPRPRTSARAARSTSTPRKRCRARGASARMSCWSASSPATRKTSAASRSSDPPGAFSTGRWRRREFPRTEVFVTNAVKHFKHEMRGKRRLHKRPNAYEIERCKIWLDLERAIVKPAAIVALGATAARSLLGRPVTISKLRGRTLHLADGTAAFVTIHPSLLLRIEDEADKEREYRNFVADLRPAAKSWQRGGLTRVARRAAPAAILRYSSSVNRPLTSAASASITSAACGPLASTVIVVPGPAASIIRPMIEVPPTVSSPRCTFTSASNFSTVCTNFAEARACSPSCCRSRARG